MFYVAPSAVLKPPNLEEFIYFYRRWLALASNIFFLLPRLRGSYLYWAVVVYMGPPTDILLFSNPGDAPLFMLAIIGLVLAY